MHITNKTVDMPLVVDDIGPRAPGKTFASSVGPDGAWLDPGAQANVDAGMRVRFCSVPEPTRTPTLRTPTALPATPTRTRTVKPFTPQHWARLPLVLKKH